METLQTNSGSITKSEAEGSIPKGVGPLSFSIEKTASVLNPSRWNHLNGMLQRAAFCMDKLTSLTSSMMALAMTLGVGSGIAGATHPVPEQTAPTLPERMTKEMIRGRLMMIEGDQLTIEVTVGQAIKLRVDRNTKMGEIVIGDNVKAYVDDSGYVTTLQRDE